MSKLKTTFILEKNEAYPDFRGVVNIIGKEPENEPYLSITYQESGHEVVSGWMADKDLERFAVNILKCLNSKLLKK
jgi:hypothetical protein